jgi:hypothetical protein
MSCADFIPMHAAAATAYLALVGKTLAERLPADGVLDVAAIALATCIPIYGARDAVAPLERIADADVARGKFIEGARCLQFSDGAAPFMRLAVTRPDLDDGMARLKRAGVNFSEARFEPSPRRVPKVAPV